MISKDSKSGWPEDHLADEWWPVDTQDDSSDLHGWVSSSSLPDLQTTCPKLPAAKPGHGERAWPMKTTVSRLQS